MVIFLVLRKTVVSYIARMRCCASTYVFKIARLCFANRRGDADDGVAHTFRHQIRQSHACSSFCATSVAYPNTEIAHLRESVLYTAAGL